MLNERRSKVLVVENEYSRRDLYRLYLEKAGYWVLEANRLRETDPFREDDRKDILSAEQLIQAHYFHGSIIDLSLDVQDSEDDRTGFEVINLINDRREGTNGIIVTGFGGTRDVKDAWKRYDAYDYLDKDDFLRGEEFLQMTEGAVKKARHYIQTLLRSQMDYSRFISAPTASEARTTLQVGSSLEIHSLVVEALSPYFPFDPRPQRGTFDTQSSPYTFLIVPLWSRYLGAGIKLQLGSTEACEWRATALEAKGNKKDIDFVLYQSDPHDKVVALVEYAPDLKIEDFAQASDERDES